jgi:hypothetical protein
MAKEALFMTVTIELTRETEAGLVAQAEAQGLSLEDYVKQLLERAAPSCRKPVSGEINLVELFAPLRGLNLTFDRNPSVGRPVGL